MHSGSNSRTATGTVGFHSPNGPTIKTFRKDDFHQLTSAEKRAIFRKNVPLYTEARKKGTAILRRLRTLAPSVVERFEVKRDPIHNLTTRVWCPQQVEGERPDSYICLSYCWNHARSTTLNDTEVSLPISELMFSAFAAQRASQRTGLWIDQLCIDQKNAAEKSMSVSAMDAVYRCAERIVIILHDVEVPLMQQGFLRSQLETHGHGWWTDTKGMYKHGTDTPPYFEKYPILKRLFYTILGSSYFTRAWCSHELQMRGRYIFCMPCQPRAPGTTHVEVFHFDSDFLLWLLVLSSRVPNDLIDGSEQRINELREKLGVILQFDNPTGKGRMSLLSEVEAASPRAMPSYPARIREIFSLRAGGDPDLSSDLRTSSALLDKTTIVLNILNNGLAIRRRKDRVVGEAECIEDLYMIGLAANDPLTLCAMGQHFYYNIPNQRLSWLQNPAHVDLGCGNERGTPSPCMIPQLAQRIQLDQSAERRWIVIDVFALGQPSPPQERFRDLAKLLLEKCLTLDMGRAPSMIPSSYEDPIAQHAGKRDLTSQMMLLMVESINSWGPGPEYQYWYVQTVFFKCRERFLWTIACILECGPIWIVKTANRCGFAGVAPVAKRLIPLVDDNAEWDIPKLSSLSWSLNESETAAVGAIMSFANWMVQWGNDRAYGMSSGCLPLIYAHGRPGHGEHSQGQAVVYMPPDALVQVVIPTVLLEDHYSRLYRVWLLEALDDPLYERMKRGEGAEWFLRAKAILFTDVEDGDTVASSGSAQDGKQGWRFRAGVKVHGPPRKVGDAIKAHLEKAEPSAVDNAEAGSWRPETSNP